MLRAAAAIWSIAVAGVAPAQPSKPPMDADKLYDLYWEQAKSDPALAENIGRMLITGAGAERNIQESARWFQIGAAAGRSYSIGRLGYLCDAVDRDHLGSYPLYRAAADLGDGPSMANTGNCLVQASHVGSGNTDPELAREYYVRGAFEGFVPGIKYLAQRILDDDLPGTRDEALFWYEFGIERGHFQFCVPAALLYQQGFDTEYNPARARALYTLAADRGYGEAYFYLWAADKFGRLGPPNPARAASLLEKGVAMKDPMCVFVDAAEAMARDDRSREAIAKNHLAMQLARLDKIVSGYDSANRQIVRLGELYLDGVVVDYDPEMAWKCFDAAADLECSQAVRDSLNNYRFNNKHHSSRTIAIKLVVVLFENACTRRYNATPFTMMPPAIDRHLAPEDVRRLEHLAAANPEFSVFARFAKDLGLDLAEEPAEADREQRLLALREKADGGSAIAAQSLAVILGDPLNPLFDADLALPLLRSIEERDPVATEALARNLIFGIGCEPDPAAAITAETKKIRYNAELHQAYARYCAAKIDRAAFLAALRAAARFRGGILPGTPLLALMAEEYPRGIEVGASYLARPEDFSNARAVHRRIARISISTSVQERASLVAAMQPEANVFLYLPNLLIAQVLEPSDVPSEQKLARDNYEKAAAVHWPLALLGLARMLEAGRGGPVDAERAAELRSLVRRIGYPSE